jgi:hypothetical protein
MNDLVEFDLEQSLAELAANSKQKILNGDGMKDNIHVLSESVRMLNELQDEEDDISIRKRKAEARRAEAEADKAEAEAKKAKDDVENAKKRETKEVIFETGKVLAPVAAAGLTVFGNFMIFKQKCNFTSHVIKLISVAEHAGDIPAITTRKVVETLWQNLKG